MKVLSTLLVIAGATWLYNVAKAGITDWILVIPPACFVLGGLYLLKSKHNE